MSVKTALKAALESEMEETTEILEDGFDEVLRPEECADTLIDESIKGEELLEGISEIATAAEETADEANAVSVEAYKRNLRHLLRPFRIESHVPAFECYGSAREQQLEIAAHAKLMIEKLRPTVESMNPAMENYLTYIFKSKAGKIKDAKDRLDTLDRKLATKATAIEENPIKIRHTGIYQFMTYDNDVCRDPVGQLKTDVKLMEDVYKVVGDDTRSFMKAVAADLRSGESLEAIYHKLLHTTNPSNDAMRVIGTEKKLMGNYKITAETIRGVSRDDAGTWKNGCKISVTSKEDVRANKASKWWFVPGMLASKPLAGVAAAATGSSLVGAALVIGGGVAMVKAFKGFKVKSHLSYKDVHDIVAETKKLVQFAEKAVNDYKEMDVAFVDTIDSLSKIKSKDEYGKAIGEMISIAYNTFHSGMQAVYKHTFFIINGSTALAETVVREGD